MCVSEETKGDVGVADGLLGLSLDSGGEAFFDADPRGQEEAQP